jgi:TrpR-related protein YerC/YecD
MPDLSPRLDPAAAAPDAWPSPAADDLLDTILTLRTREEATRFFRDLCTLAELREMSQRWQVVRLLDLGRHYGEISRETGVSTATITRIAQWFRHGEGGYRLALARRPTADLRRQTGESGSSSRGSGGAR